MFAKAMKITLLVALLFVFSSFAKAQDSFRMMPPLSLLLNPKAVPKTPKKSQLLEYLVSCALPQGVELKTDTGDGAQRFSGSLGLAPNWLNRGLTTSEQPWVSACILARTNLFGKRIEISMRALDPAPAGLLAPKKEWEEFIIHEGAFFGNIFASKPRAFACLGKTTPRQSVDPVLQKRVCAQPSGSLLPSGEKATRCGFAYVGSCKELEHIAPDASGYTEVIHTYLRPTESPDNN